MEELAASLWKMEAPHTLGILAYPTTLSTGYPRRAMASDQI